MNDLSDLNNITESVINLCIKRNLNIGFAESCTGGLISSVLTSYPGVSAIFKGSVVCYAGEVKTSVLGVPDSCLKSFGEVSVPVARRMATGAREVLNCDWSLSVTGIAGPGGGSPEKPVGTVCFGISGPAFEWSVENIFRDKQRQKIQLDSAKFGLESLKQAILGQL